MKRLTLLGLLVIIMSCKTENKSALIDQDYKTGFETYKVNTQDNRIKYLQLTGLFKIDSTINTFGKNSNNTFVLPINDLPEIVGTISKTDSLYSIMANEGLFFGTGKDSTLQSSILPLDENGSSMKLFYNQLSWQIITRSGSQYLRVWDAKNPMVTDFKGFELFELNSEFIFEGDFKYFEAVKTEEVNSQLGVNASTKFIGQLSFDYNGTSYQLDVGSNGFTMVSDATTGNETYGGGRYVYLDLPETNGKVHIDFNRLYNPPCSFSTYTTCLYPPRQNNLPFKILAGETITRNK